MDGYRFENIKAITFSSMMSAVSIVLVLLTHFSGDIGLFLIFFLPLCASLVSVFVRIKYALIYILSTFLICCFDFQLALFIIIPCLLSGFTLGILIKKNINGYFIILVDALILLILQILTTYLINFIYQIDLILLISSIIKVDFETFDQSYFLFLFTLSLIQASLNYLIVTNELKKFHYIANDKKNLFLFNILLFIVILLLNLSFLFINQKIGFLLLGISGYISIVIGYYNFSYRHKKIVISVQLPLFAVSFILMLYLLSVIEKIFYPYLYLIPMISELITSLIIISYQKCIKKDKISSSMFDNLK